jgi:catechol 2,3-dioxygenase-like lactoylglutathione lyase family enzyme
VKLPFLFCAAGLLLAETRFHHAHLRTTDPAQATEFYTKRLGAKPSELFGQPALETSHGTFVLEKVTELAPTQTALWHFGWGATDIRAAYIRQLDLRTPLAQPLENLLPGLFFCYLAAPEGVLVEINSSKREGFGHVHLYSLYPHIAGEWYARYLGLKPLRPLSSAPVKIGRYEVSSEAALDAGGVGILFFPKPANVAELAPSENSAVDHLAFTVDNLDQRLLDLRKSGARILEMPKEIAPRVRSAMVMGPDRMRLELIEKQ